MASDPLTRLALAMATDPGVYALLLGSGVSTSAGVPTGWGVQVDLMRKVARAENAEVDEGDGEALAAWWEEVHGNEPSYSVLLKELAATSTERQSLLRGYFTPTEQERAEGTKVPGAAHRAIARLVANGAVRLILTTNFDRLIEQALNARGIDHDLWASEEEIRGGIPLEHGRVVIVKLHGDYRRTNLRNTESELSSYPDRVDELLDQVFDAFGVVVCGWSGEYDRALREAMQRTTNRRYSWWWSIRGSEPSGVAAELVAHREAILLPDRDADALFTELADRHAAVREREGEDLEDLAVAREVTARRAADPSQHQRLLEDILESAISVREALTDQERFPALAGSITAEEVVSRAAALVELVRPVAVKLATVMAGADADIAFSAASRTFEVLADVENHGVLSRAPLQVAWYGAGVVAVDHDRLKLLHRLAIDVSVRRHDRPEPMVAAAHPWRLVDGNGRAAQWLANQGPQETKYYAPISQWLEPVCRDLLDQFPVTATEDRWQTSFDRFEWACSVMLAALGHAQEPGEGPYIPSPHVGNFGGRHVYRYDPRGWWADLIEWASEQADRLLPAANEDDREEILDTHLEHVHKVAETWW